MDKIFFAKAWEVVKYFQKKESTEKMINVSEVPHILRAVNLDMIFEKAYRDGSQYLATDDISEFFQNYLRTHTSIDKIHNLRVDLSSP